MIPLIDIFVLGLLFCFSSSLTIVRTFFWLFFGKKSHVLVHRSKVYHTLWLWSTMDNNVTLRMQRSLWRAHVDRMIMPAVSAYLICWAEDLILQLVLCIFSVPPFLALFFIGFAEFFEGLSLGFPFTLILAWHCPALSCWFYCCWGYVIGYSLYIHECSICKKKSHMF